MSREEQILQLIRECLSGFDESLRGYRVFLFGSRATGTAHERSDFDLGVFGAEPFPLKPFYEIENALENLPTLYRIDWLDLNRVSDEFRDVALSEAKVLYG
jgi:predicted nucleotidyltransferase